MSSFDKLIQKIFAGSNVSYADAEKVLLALGFDLKTNSSHHVFRKNDYEHICLKKRSELQPYQIKDLQEVLLDHDYRKENSKKRP